MRGVFLRCGRQHCAFSAAITNSIGLVGRTRPGSFNGISRHIHCMNNQPHAIGTSEPAGQAEVSRNKRRGWRNGHRQRGPKPAKPSNAEAPNTDANPDNNDANLNKNKKPPKPKEPRPDHFLALQLSHHPDVTSSLSLIQSSIATHSPHLEPSFIDPASAHITLGVLSLPDDPSKEAATAALHGAASAAGLSGPCPVTLQGLGHFRNEVLYLEVSEGGNRDVLDNLVGAVRGHFRDQNLLLQADRDFVPHVTVAKLSKMKPWGGRRTSDNRRNNKKKKDEEDVGKEEGIILEVESDQITKQIISNDGSNREVPIEHNATYEASGGFEIPLEDAGPAAASAGICAPAAVHLDNSSRVNLAAEAGSATKGNAGEGNTARISKKERLQIPPESYAEHAEVSASVEVAELQLCAMEGRKKGEYYKVIASVSLVQEWGNAAGAVDVAMEDKEET